MNYHLFILLSGHFYFYLILVYVYIYIYMKSEAIHETGLSGNVVTSFFPLIIFIYIYISFSLLFIVDVISNKILSTQ